MTTIIRIDAAEYQDHDDCLTVAAEEYASELGLEGWDLDARYEDDQRDIILLTVPADDNDSDSPIAAQWDRGAPAARRDR